MARFNLTNHEGSLIAPLLLNKPRGVPRVDDLRLVNGNFWRLRSGSIWRDLAERYGPYATLSNRYDLRAKTEVWLRFFEALAHGSPDSLHLIDSTIVRAHPHASEGKSGAPIAPLAVLVED